jgi:hypothetical protein
MGCLSNFFSTLCRQSTKALGKAVLTKNLFHSAKNFAVFLTLHYKDFLNAAGSNADYLEG